MQASTADEETTTGEARHPRVAKLRLLWDASDRLRRAASLGLIVGALVAFLLPVKYESTAQLMPPDPQSGSSMAMLAALSSKTGSSLEGVSSELLGIKSSGALFLGILASRTVQDRLNARFNLKKVYRRHLDEDARRDLTENTRAWEERHSGIITIAVTDHDRKRAAEITAAYVDELNRLVAELSTSAAHRERIFLEQRLAAVKSNLDRVSEQFSQFASKNTAIDIKEQGRAMIEVAANLTGQLIAAESELTGLEQIYTGNNVRVRAVEARIRELRTKLTELGGADTGPATRQIPTAKQPYPTLRELPLLGVTYSDLYRETKIQESVYETLTEQYELAKVQEAKETPTVRVLDAPVVPETRSFPPRLQIIFFSICLAVMARAFGILGRAHWQAIDAADPLKVFVQEVWDTFRAWGNSTWAEMFRLTLASRYVGWVLRLKRTGTVLSTNQN
jgi:uncharacterized protein involved in exopolysaccharide biosynthesis